MSSLVFNASPLILFGKIGQIRLVEELPYSAVVPEEVAKEVRCGPANDPAREWLSQESTGERIVRSCYLDERVAAWGLGAGEAAVISHMVREPKGIAVLDDRAARRCAAVFQVRFVGTVGLIIKAKRMGLLGAIRPVLEELERKGSFLGVDIKDEALRLAGER